MPVTAASPDDLTPINAAIADLQKRVAALEAQPKPPPPPTPSGATPDNTWHTKATDPAIVDDAGNAYTLVDSSAAGKGLQIAKNAAVDPPTQNVTRLGILHRQVHQQNNAGGWWVDAGIGKTNSTNWTSENDPTAPPAPTPTGAFHVSGGRIVDSNGNPFRAKGVNVCYIQEWGNGQVDIGRISRTALQRAFPGINFVRFACWDGGLPPVGDATTLAWINDLTSHGIIVLMDLHYTGNAISPNDGTANGWFNGWSKLLANNPGVWWDTQNEPHGGGTAISAMQLGQYNAIRSGGSQSPILLCCGNPGAEMAGQNPADYAQMSNVAFDLHYYGWIPSNGMTWDGLVNQLRNYQSKDGAIPVLCLETGDSTDGNNRDANWQQVLATSLAVPGGFAAWYMNWNDQGGDRLLASPFDGSALTDYGQVVANAIKTG